AGFAVLATACWTWYPIRNARWLRSDATRSAATWATAQGLATLPLAAIGMAVATAWDRYASVQPMGLPLGPEPWRFVAWMLALGLLASWLGTLWWNAAARRLPTSLAGQLIVFETLSALSYAWLLRRAWPDPATLAGAALLVAGVILGVGAFARATATPTAAPAPTATRDPGARHGGGGGRRGSSGSPAPPQASDAGCFEIPASLPSVGQRTNASQATICVIASAPRPARNASASVQPPASNQSA